MAQKARHCKVCDSQLTATGKCNACLSAAKRTRTSKKPDVLAAEKETAKNNKPDSNEYRVFDGKQKKAPSAAFLYNKQTRERYELSSTVSKVGRDRNNKVSLSVDHYISRHHAWVLYNNNAFWIEDLGSANGTLLNGELINERKQLSAGDKLTFGKTELTFCC